MIIGWQTTTEVTIPGYWAEEDVFGWVDNGYWAPGVHDDAAPEHDDPDDPDDPGDDDPNDPDDPDDPDSQCTIDPITLIADCTDDDPDDPDEEDDPQSLAEMTDEQLAALGYMRCPGEVLVTTGVLCPGDVEYATEEPDGGCPDGSEWTEEFGGRCVTEAMELWKCDEEGENCNQTPPIRTYCPAHSSLMSVSAGPVEIDGSEYTVCYFSCDHGDSDLAELIEDRVGYQTDCGSDDLQDPVCPNGDPMPATGGCCVDGTPAPPGGCAPVTCPTGDPMPDEGCCPNGAPATADGCCVDGTPAPPGGCAAVTCPTGDPMPDEGCCPNGEPAAADGCDTELTCPNGDPVPATGGCCVDGTPAPPGGCGTATCPNGDPVPAGGCPTTTVTNTPQTVDCGSIIEAAGWAGAHNLADPPRDPYAQSGTPRPPYDVVAGGLVWVPPRQDAGGIGCELAGRVCFERASTPVSCAGRAVVAANTQVPSPPRGSPSVELGWLIEWQWCAGSGAGRVCVGPDGDPEGWHSESGLDVFFDIFSWSNVSVIG